MNGQRVPDVLVEQLALGELPPLREADVLRRLEAEPGGLARLEALRASDAEILRAHPPERVARAVGGRVPRPQRRPLVWLAVPLAAAATAAIVFVVTPTDRTRDGLGVPGVERTHTERPLPGDHGTTRIKGDARLLVHRQAPGGSEELASGSAARMGDRLQLGYLAGPATHGVIMSVDGRGAVSLHFPRTAGASTRLTAGRALLDFSYELDDAPRFERFVLVTAERPIDVPLVLAAAERAGESGPLPLPDGLAQTDFLLKKVGP